MKNLAALPMIINDASRVNDILKNFAENARTFKEHNGRDEFRN